jgi:hypothetical protein
MRMPHAAARATHVKESGRHSSPGVKLECSAMTPRLPPSQAPRTRNPVARSLALAVLGLALIGAAVMGAVVFAVLLGVFVIGYLLSFAHAWWRLFQLRRRAAFVDQPPSRPAEAGYLEGEYEVVEATADVAQRGSGGSA